VITSAGCIYEYKKGTVVAERRPCLPGSYYTCTGLRIIFSLSRVLPLVILSVCVCLLCTEFSCISVSNVVLNISHVYQYLIDLLCGRVPGYRSRGPVRFPSLPDFLRTSGSGTGSAQPYEYNGETT
jgi:hypothetical protein